MPRLNSLALIVSEISAFIRTEKQTDRRILIKNIYTLWGRIRFLMPVTYFPTDLVYPFTLRVTGIKRGRKFRGSVPKKLDPQNFPRPFRLEFSAQADFFRPFGGAESFKQTNKIEWTLSIMGM